MSASTTSNNKLKSRVQENLLNLYLRLNGFFTTGFIVHAPPPKTTYTEIDALAIRFPFNDEPERVVKPSAYLDTSTKFIDILICEVKSRRETFQFNRSLRDPHEVKIIESVLRWTGIFNKEEVQALAVQVQAKLQPNQPNQDIPTVLGPKDTRIRGILCSPECLSKRPNQPWFIHGQEIFSHLWNCFCPNEPRVMCSESYDFGLWGESYEQLVRYFKDRKKQHLNEGNMTDLYQYLGI